MPPALTLKDLKPTMGWWELGARARELIQGVPETHAKRFLSRFMSIHQSVLDKVPSCCSYWASEYLGGVGLPNFEGHVISVENRQLLTLLSGLSDLKRAKVLKHQKPKRGLINQWLKESEDHYKKYFQVTVQERDAWDVMKESWGIPSPIEKSDIGSTLRLAYVLEHYLHWRRLSDELNRGNRYFMSNRDAKTKLEMTDVVLLGSDCCKIDNPNEELYYDRPAWSRATNGPWAACWGDNWRPDKWTVRPKPTHLNKEWSYEKRLFALAQQAKNQVWDHNRKLSSPDYSSDERPSKFKYDLMEQETAERWYPPRETVVVYQDLHVSSLYPSKYAVTESLIRDRLVAAQDHEWLDRKQRYRARAKVDQEELERICATDMLELKEPTPWTEFEAELLQNLF